MLLPMTWDEWGGGGGLRIDQHGIKRLAHNVELGDAGGKSVSVGVEDIEFCALDDVNNAAAGDRLQAGHVKVLAEGRLCWKLGAGVGRIENAQAAPDGIGSRTRIDSASAGGDVNAVVGESHLFMGPVGDGDSGSGSQRAGINHR